MANGTLAGSVRNIATMQPIDGATITAQPGDHTTNSGPDGSWALSVAEGTYELGVTANGFDPGDYPGIVAIDDVTTDLPFVLHPTY